MKRVRIYRVSAPPSAFAPLLEAACAAGLRVGWLSICEPEPPAPLSAAIVSGATRTAMAGERLTLTARRRRGPAVLEDLLRREFAGCRVVLVDGEVEAPHLQPVPEGGWSITGPAGEELAADPSRLVAIWQRPKGTRKRG